MMKKLDIYGKELLEAVKICRSMIRHEMIEHAVVDTKKPNEGLGDYLDKLIAKYEPSDSPRVILEKKARKVMDTLSGSGFNASWDYSETITGIFISSKFHIMNDNGYYVGWAHFSVLFRWNEPANEFRLRFHGPNSQYLARRHGLREHIENSIVHLVIE